MTARTIWSTVVGAIAGRVARRHLAAGLLAVETPRARSLAGALVAAVAIGLIAGDGRADGTEQLGDPVGLAVQTGTDVLVAGVGLSQVQPRTITLTVPPGQVVKQFLLYWEGQALTETAHGEFDTITVNGQSITGKRIGGPTLFFVAPDGDAWTSTYRADLSDQAGLFAGQFGVFSLSVGGLNFDKINCGAGIMVVVEELGQPAEIAIRDGNDAAFEQFLSPLDKTVPQTFTFPAAGFQRTANVAMMFGSVANQRPNILQFSVDGQVVDTLVDVLGNNAGEEWDTLNHEVTIPAMATSLTVEAISGDAGTGPFAGGIPASLVWVATGVSLQTGVFGACCFDDGTCAEMMPDACTQAGGNYLGDGTGCSPNPCPQPTGACCLPDGTCSDGETMAACETGLSGTWQGPGTTCATTTCPGGACCLPNGMCTDDTTQPSCEQSMGGVWQGLGSTCATTTCTGGACCLDDGTCIDQMAQPDCETTQGGVWQGLGSGCATVTCPGGACCLADGSCVDDTTQPDCETTQGGTWQGLGSTCATTACPGGACCLADGSCVDDTTQSDCETTQGGAWQGLGSTCATTTCPGGACCLPNGMCTDDTTEASCEQSMGGVWQGLGSTCATTTCTGGACCLDDGTCIDQMAQPDCETTQGGAWQGLGSSCATATCPGGACCLADGSCIDDTTQPDCETTQGGTWQGLGSTCAATTCPGGACCLPNGMCTDDTTEASCEQSMGGVWQGLGSTCATTTCPGGACCLDDGTCIDAMAQPDCETTQGGAWQGLGSSCATVSCPGGACCLADGSCVDDTTQAECETTQGGTWQGLGSTCATTACPGGACCLPDGTCVGDITQSLCELLQGGTWQGLGSDCAAANCPGGACCLDNGSCADDTDQTTCEQTMSGTWQGLGSTCATTACPGGACCLTDGSAVDGTSQGECEQMMGGVWQGLGSTSATAVCLGACCLPDETCVDQVTVGDCTTALAGTYRGLASSCAAISCTSERDHPGWNWIDVKINLTGNQPTYWSALTGLPKGVSPFTILDYSSDPLMQGRPDPEGSGDRVLRGYIYAFAVNVMDNEISWNHLKGDALLVNYRDGSAWEYNTWAFQAIEPTPGVVLPDPGVLNLDGMEYVQGFSHLLLDFSAVGSGELSGGSPFQHVTTNTDLTLHPIDADLRQNGAGPMTTKATFVIWNENETQFTGLHRCITCWDQTLLSQYADAQNHFLLSNLQTDRGKARIDGLASTICSSNCCIPRPMGGGNHPGCASLECQDLVCQVNSFCCSTEWDDECVWIAVELCDECVGVNDEAALLGLSARALHLGGGAIMDRAGVNLIGMGTESGVVRWDPELVGPPPVMSPDEEIERILDIGFLDAGPLSRRHDQPGTPAGGGNARPLTGAAPPPPGPVPPVADRVSGTEKGSLLIFSKVEIRWDAAGNVVQDTFIDLTNDWPGDVMVKMYFINGDPPLNGGE